MVPLIVVPWRPGQADREKAWAYLRPIYEELRWPIAECDSGDEPFNRARSQNQGAASREWDVILVLDADCWVPKDQINRGVLRARKTGGVVLPHDRYVPLSEAETERVYAGGPIPLWSESSRASRNGARGGLHIISKRAWDLIGGYDPVRPRAQDTRLLEAAEAGDIPLDRIPGSLVHFFHRRPDKEVERTERIAQVRAYLGTEPPIGSYAWQCAVRDLRRAKRQAARDAADAAIAELQRGALR